MFEADNTYDKLFEPGKALDQPCKDIFHLMIETQQCEMLRLVLEKNLGIMLAKPFGNIEIEQDSEGGTEVEPIYITYAIYSKKNRILKMIMSDPSFSKLLSVGCSVEDGSVINSPKALHGIQMLSKEKKVNGEEDGSGSDSGSDYSATSRDPDDGML